MHTPRTLFVLYWRLVGAQVRSQMQYKVSFLLNLTGAFLATIIDFLAVAVLFTRLPHLAGWSLGEVALLYGMSSVSFALAEMLSAALDEFDVYIAHGTFDRVLVRPLRAFFQVLTEDFRLRRLGRLSQGALVLWLALAYLDLRWTPDKVALLAVALGSGFVIYFSILVLGAVFCFWTVQGKEATNIFTYGGDFMTSYPLEIYSDWLRKFATFIVPLAFVNYYPALYLLDRTDPFGLPGWVRLLSPLVAILLALLAWAAWTLGVRRYQSAGS
ncbi:MAG: hypothetical protein C4289_14075 [Chloroflexota bacterium]